ncbi:ChrR family anti-sigma-E factor [Roseiarcaceae bacterium H3SJ34-1]|uniref:ChrR family anti-sigma-E factor n=1 Tax=Terripilifer ovatus TaxID=3032367 RepID=UPI003AB99D0E|nr:ChrR family anti-sigma-E factor [Roseiarcaceae bacterium H3SJ34-1]
MSISHHPSDLLLADFAANTLDEANALVIATHLSMCPQCRMVVGQFECLGGALLDGLPSQPFDSGRRARALAEIEAELPPALPPRARPQPRTDVDSLIGLYGAGSWRWTGPGVYWRPLDVPVENGTRAFLLRAAPGTALLNHRHSGTELTLVLKGAFSHELGRFAAGDVEEADIEIAHSPVVDKESECICLVAMQGDIRLQGWIGRLMQPFVRF